MKVFISRKTFRRKYMSHFDALVLGEYSNDLGKVYKLFMNTIEEDLGTNYNYELTEADKDNIVLRFLYGAKEFDIKLGKEVKIRYELFI